MPVRIRTATAAGAAVLAMSMPAAAQDSPKGTWMVKDRTAVVRIVDCGGQYWGVVAWERTPGVDRHNPDPALRSRPTLGMPVLLGLRPDGQDSWSGHIYNAEDGQTYDSHIKLTGANALQVEGCLLGFMCGGETWSRAATPATPAVAQNRHPSEHSTTGAGHPRRPIAEQSEAQVCSALGRR